MTSHLILWLIVVPSLATILVPSLGIVLPHWRPALFKLAHVACCALAVVALTGSPADVVVAVRRGALDLQFGLILDYPTGIALILAALLLLIVGWFSQGYVRGARYATAFLSLLLLEQGAINVVLLAGDLVTLYAGLLVLSFALMFMIGLDFVASGGNAALRVFASLEVPAAFAFVGFWLIDARAGTTSLADLARRPDWLNYSSSWALLLPIVVTLVGRAGLAPLQNWVVSGCRAAIAPASVAIAGVALPVGALVLARLVGTVVPADSLWTQGLTLLGVLTAVVCGVGALRENTVPGWLGYLAAGQVGLATVGLTVAGSIGRLAGMVDLATVALAITTVGLAAGLAMQESQHNRLTALAALPRIQRVRWPLAIGLLALATVPPFGTYTERQLILSSLLDQGAGWRWVVAGAFVVGTTLLAAAVWKTLFRLVLGQPDEQSADLDGQAHLTKMPPNETIGGIVGLASIITLVGALDPLRGSFVTAAVSPWPTSAATVASSVLLFLAIVLSIGGTLVAGRIEFSNHHLDRVADLLSWLWRRGRLDRVLDPYVVVGWLLLTTGQISAATLNQTIGRLARAR